jgi:arylsulfatase A-like enzyme
MRLFGFGRPGPGMSSHTSGDQRTWLPNIEAIAAQGVTFTNAWSMPECSASRAAFLTGRLPQRMGVLGVIREGNLANSHV